MLETMTKIPGKPIQIVYVDESNEKNKFYLDEEALSSILLQPSICDKVVVVLSVAGAFRKGKSFLLDFFLRYMATSETNDWLGDHDTPLEGFPWRGGSERYTTGILLWSEPFSLQLPSGEEVAVLFMDTQGSFDSSSTVKQCATVFALSTLLSSIQIYNIHGNIQEDHLQHLHLFTEYGRLAMESESSETPFQHLLFLVRDWSFPYEYDFGSIGGNKLLEMRLKIQPNHQTEHQTVRHHIRSCFSRLTCFLLPHPGLCVASSPNFNGRLSDIEPKFLEELGIFIPTILAPATLQLKRINGQKVTCKEWLTYFKAYMNIYQGDTLPEPRSMLEATAEANNLNAIMKSRDFYAEMMNKVCGPERPYLNPNEVELAHSQAFNKAVENFNQIRKMGGAEYAAIYLERLKTTLDQMGGEYRLANTNKNVFQTFRTPAVFCVILLIFYIITGFSSALGLSSVTTMFLYPFYMVLVLLLTWIILNYTGRAPEVTRSLDSVADVVLDKAINPALEHVSKRSLQHLVGTDLSSRSSRTQSIS